MRASLHGAAFDVRDGSHQGPPAWEGVGCFAVSEEGGVASALRSWVGGARGVRWVHHLDLVVFPILEERRGIELETTVRPLASQADFDVLQEVGVVCWRQPGSATIAVGAAWTETFNWSF